MFRMLHILSFLALLHMSRGEGNSPPVFVMNHCCKTISENNNLGAVVLQVNATDRDLNDTLTYTLVTGSDYFAINSSSGIVTTINRIDRERLSNDILAFKVEVSDGVYQPNTGSVCLLVNDENDNYPIFVNTSYSVAIHENTTVGWTVFHTRATDADEGTNSHVQYKIMKGNEDDYFSISLYNGDITLEKSLDYESHPMSYVLTVEAYDLGNPSLSATAHVVINIANINEHNPVFDKAVFAGNQDEETPAHTFILTARASDLDSGVFGKLSYSIVGGNDDGRFYINSTTGNISNAMVLDREQQNLYNLVVEATDGGPNNRTAQANVTIVINDINDNPPEFDDKNKYVNVPENNRVGISVATFSATDNDIESNSLLMYKIVTGNTGNAFDIPDPFTGIVTARSSLDYEAIWMYTLKIEVRDGGPNGGMADYATLIVYVGNLDDNIPQFDSPSYNFMVPENEINAIVGRVSATDADGQVSYRLVGLHSNRFSIGAATGQIATNGALDHEQADGKLYHLVVVAEDKTTTDITVRHETSASVTVRVIDKNDNDPLFEKREYTTTIEEEQPRGQSIAKVSATDRDSSTSGHISYAIVDGLGKDNFAIDSLTGNIYTTTTLDRETHNSYTLTLQAKDNGLPSRSTTATLTVTVKDINDNKPYFHPDTPHEVSLPENTTIGTTVLTVRARDDDVGRNGMIVFSLEGDEGKFGLNESTGELTTVASLGRETSKMSSPTPGPYMLTVIATDSGNVPKSETWTIAVTVIESAKKSKDAASPAIGVVTVLALLFLHVVVTNVLGF